MKQYTSDVVIIGGGITGIVAALELLSAGRKVLLLDRDVEVNFGGLAKESFGGVFVVDSVEQRRAGCRDSPELAYRDLVTFGELDRPDPDLEWPKKWARAYVDHCNPDVYEWLKERGASFVPLPHWIERGQFTPGNSLPRFHIVWGAGYGLINHLLMALERHPQRRNLTIQFDHRVDELLISNGRVIGCRGLITVRENQSPFDFEATGGAVIVAAGGINGDMDRVRANWHLDWGQPPEVILNGSHKFADGRLHDAVVASGGKLTHMDRMWNYAAGVHHWNPRKPNHGLSLVPPRSALWLNWQGKRIGPQPLVTGFDTRDLVTQVCRQERQYSWQLLNMRIAAKELAVSGAEFNVSIREKRKFSFIRELLFGNMKLVNELLSNCEDFVVGHSLAELVEKMNALNGDDAVDLNAVTDVVARYDEQIDRGPRFHNDEQLRRIAYVRKWRGDRLRTCKFQKILDDKALPLIAIREFIVSRKSLGGIQTNLDGQVLDLCGKPIPGLFAAGEATGFGGGGMNGLRALEGTFLGGCIFSGRRAGLAAR